MLYVFIKKLHKKQKTLPHNKCYDFKKINGFVQENKLINDTRIGETDNIDKIYNWCTKQN